MSTCRDIATAAYRKIGALGAGRSMSAAQAEAAMSALQGLYEGWIAGGKFGALRDRLVCESHTARENERIVINTTDAITITIPDTLRRHWGDWGCSWAWGCCDEWRPPLDLALIAVVDPSTSAGAIGVYDGLSASWVSLVRLALTDPAPLSNRGRDGLACCLAMRLADEYGQQVTPMTLRSAALFESALSRSVRHVPEPQYF